MTEKLFVYGTLAPGRPNEHILKDVNGSWETACVKGVLHNRGWGAEMGYPGIILDESADEIRGFIFTSEHLSSQWERLDEFEGDAYLRVLTKVKLENGDLEDASIYTLRSR